MIKDFLYELIHGDRIKDAHLKREFFTLLLNATIVTAAATILFSIGLKKHFYCIFTYFVLFIFLSILHYVGNKDTSIKIQKRIYVSYCFFMGIVFFPLIYLFGGGIESGAPLFLIISTLSIFLLLDNLLLVVMLVLQFLATLIIGSADYANEGFINSFTSLGDFTYLDISLNAVFIGIGVGVFLRKLTSFFEENQKKATLLLKQIEDASTKDPLTGAYNRRYLMEALNRHIAKVDSGELRSFSILMFDIDHFKNINDTYGHLAGDDCIKNLALILNNLLRDFDIVTRYGGEEFVCVLPTADDTSAFRRAEQIRITVESTQLSEDIDIKVTVSGGVAMYIPGTTADQLLNEADSNLYLAKKQGRNQICWRDGEAPPPCYVAYGNTDTIKPVQNAGRRFSDATQSSRF